MEKRFVLFFVLSVGVLLSYSLLRAWLVPAPLPGQAGQPVAEAKGEPGGDESLDGGPADGDADREGAAGDEEKEPAGADAAVSPDSDPASPADPPVVADGAGDDRADDAADAPSADPAAPPFDAADDRSEWISVGSYRPTGESPLLVTFSNRGGTVVAVELTERTESGKLRYHDLYNRSGYLGNLALTPSTDPEGCRVNVVGHATPAATGRGPSDSEGGLQAGDVILQIGDTTTPTPVELDALLRTTKPGQTARLVVSRGTGAGSRKMEVSVELGVRPLQLIQPLQRRLDELVSNPPSLKLGLTSNAGGEGEVTVPLEESIWEARRLEAPEKGVEFRCWISARGEVTDGRDEAAALEVVKRFQLGRMAELAAEDSVFRPYHVDFEMEVINLSDQTQQFAYSLRGPNGLPLEGWWYSNKLHPTTKWSETFSVAGARDIIWETEAEKHRFLGCSALAKQVRKEPANRSSPLFGSGEEPAYRKLEYAGVDTQYFLAALKPVAAEGQPETLFDRASAYVVDASPEAIPKSALKTTNVSFQLRSPNINVAAGKSFRQSFVLFAGPKDAELLQVYGLQDAIYYGWFSSISRLLAWLLHFFYAIIGNYGLAIVMLTVLVRSAMFPISRKAAKNAAMMQELAPEMKKIAEKYKDMEKRAKAQQELFKKHNYNPLGGCWLMFLQLPIFIGLYRALSVDIELRQAPLIPGVRWASNLAGPDMALYWRDALQWSLFTEIGMLGPYLNILPIFTVALFLAHQKLFTPPATDEQSKMQLTMMKYMTLFIGLMFFKVASGLCLYFIASSLWGIAERKLLPKKGVKSATAAAASTPARKPEKPTASRGKKPADTRSGSASAPASGNGSPRKSQNRPKKRRKR